MQGCNLQEREMDLKARFAAPLPNVQICHSWMRTGLFLCQLSSVPARRDPLKHCSSHPNTPEALHLIQHVYSYRIQCEILWWTFDECHAQLLHCILHVQYCITIWHMKLIYGKTTTKKQLWDKKLILWQSFDTKLWDKKS